MYQSTNMQVFQWSVVDFLYVIEIGWETKNYLFFSCLRIMSTIDEKIGYIFWLDNFSICTTKIENT